VGKGPGAPEEDQVGVGTVGCGALRVTSCSGWNVGVGGERSWLECLNKVEECLNKVEECLNKVEWGLGPGRVH
jgi:hypothetical protein